MNTYAEVERLNESLRMLCVTYVGLTGKVVPNSNDSKKPDNKKDSSQANPDKDPSSNSNGEMTGENDEQDNSEADESSLTEGEENNPDKEEGKPSKSHPKRNNEGYNPVQSHLHFHETLKAGNLCPECL